MMTLTDETVPSPPRRVPGPLAMAPVAQVRVDDEFWRGQQDQTRTLTLPAQLDQMRRKGYLEALTLTWEPGDWYTPHVFWDSDLAKWVEAASYSLATDADPELARDLDDVVARLAAAQQADGYLNSYFCTVGKGRRFTDHQDAHELYCAGHLIEAGVAHFESTGSRVLLEVVCRYADLIDAEFSADGPAAGGYDGHPEIELALMRLYRVTGQDRYLELACRLVDNRGQRPFFFAHETERRGDAGMFADIFPGRAAHPDRYATYQQSHLPVRAQTEAVGHAVRAVYLYTGAFDVAEATGDAELGSSVRGLWDDIVGRKMQITGNIGSDRRWEAFGPGYDLPRARGYGETCASIGMANWAARIGNATRDAAYFEVLETELYNGALAGKSEDGTRYFYENQLSSDGSLHRHDWFDTSCCPPNLARFIGGLGRLIYSISPQSVAVNLLISSTLDASTDGSRLVIRQDSHYPRAGRARFVVETGAARRLELSIRIPASAQRIRLDGVAVAREDLRRGYLVLDREWSGTTLVEVSFDIPVETVTAHPSAVDLRGLVAFRRGPVVYCLEEVDAGFPTAEAIVQLGTVRVALTDPSAIPRLVVEGKRAQPTTTALYSSAAPLTSPAELRLVPYYSWGNREPGSMDVWLRPST